MQNEVWVPVNGFENFYMVSSHGRVKSLDRTIYTYGGERSFVRKGKVLKAQKNMNGYLYVRLCKYSKETHYTMGRIVAEHFVDNPKSKPEVNHIDGDKENNYPENLEWVTSSENQIHAHRTGLQTIYRGDEHSNSKLTSDEVINIRRRYKNEDIYQRELAKEYNVTTPTICRVVNNKIWAHI